MCAPIEDLQEIKEWQVKLAGDKSVLDLEKQ